VGCAVLVTRSLFECVTLQVPLGMFDGVPVDGRGTPRIEALDHIYQDIALDVFDYVPFDLATIGFQSGCCLFAELQADEQQCFDLLNAGSIFARDDVLRALNVWPDDYPAARPGLRWIPPGY